jgi:hypothetical protein
MLNAVLFSVFMLSVAAPFGLIALLCQQLLNRTDVKNQHLSTAFILNFADETKD